MKQFLLSSTALAPLLLLCAGTLVAVVLAPIAAAAALKLALE